jgi:hypothetical protein
LDIAELLICGGSEVFAVDPEHPTDFVWHWDSADRTDIPEHLTDCFGSLDECKPVNGGSHVLITSSGGAVALIDKATQDVVFISAVANAHSADLLPGNRIIAAASHLEDKGDRLILFDIDRPEEALWSDDLPKGHGAVWDESRSLFWALSNTDIRSYTFRDWASDRPSLELVSSTELPEPGGHELSWADNETFHVTTSNECWQYQLETHTITRHPILGGSAQVKSISSHPDTGRIAYTQGEGGNWWSENIHLKDPDRSLSYPGKRLYKCRWQSAMPGARLDSQAAE